MWGERNMINYNIIFFDLDGTLLDPRIGITLCVQYALKAFDIDKSNLDSLCKFIGPPLKESFMEFYGFDDNGAVQAVAKYRERYRDIGIFESEIYPGIDDLLQRLCAAGRRLVVATSKPTVFAKRLLEHFHIVQYFEFISGSELDNTRTNKGEVILYALQQMRINDTSNVLMIGDREHDIIGAKKAGIASVGVLYGYGSYHELKAAGADYIVEDIAGLKEILLQ